jgi:hypothetical protein
MRSSLGDRSEDRSKDRKRECRATLEDEIKRLRHWKGAGRVGKRSPWVRNMVGQQPMEAEAKGSMNRGQNQRREPKSEKARDWWHTGRTPDSRAKPEISLVKGKYFQVWRCAGCTPWYYVVALAYCYGVVLISP